MQRLLHIRPESQIEIWRAAVLSFSVPAWLSFILSDHSRGGATLGKRLWHVRVVDQRGQRLSLGRATGRTAIKLLPWELAHLVFVAAAASRMQMLLIVAANLLVLVYLAVAIATHGRRSIHDFAVGTVVVPTTR